METQKNIAIYWSDVTSFSKGVIRKPSRMYTEGTLMKESDSGYFILKPTTLKMGPQGTRNHPDEDVELYYIPKSLVSSVESKK